MALIYITTEQLCKYLVNIQTALTRLDSSSNRAQWAYSEAIW